MRNYAIGTIVMLLIHTGCHTTASFILPPNTDLMINGERVSLDSKGEDGNIRLERRPFFWTSIGGIEYMLLQGDNVVKKDRLPSSFRVVSIFWPPYAYIYWPVGFRFKCYDLSDLKKEFVEKCGEPAKSENKIPKPSGGVNTSNSRGRAKNAVSEKIFENGSTPFEVRPG